jgi:phenylacetate-CoA ligase
VERFERLLPDLVTRIDWSPERIRSERVAALRRLLSVAVERSPWHRARLAGLDIAHVSEASLSALPVMTKGDLMANFDEIVCDRRVTRVRCEAHLSDTTAPDYLLDGYSVVASSGSSGQRGVFVYGWDAWATCYASIVRFPERDWATDPSLAALPRVTAVVAAAQPTHVSAALSRTFSSPRTPRRPFPVSLPLAEIVAGLNDLQPTVLQVYSSFLPHLCSEAEIGRLRIAPRRVICMSETLLPEVRAAAEATWGAPVANGYGMSEGLFTGSCRYGIHLSDDLCLIEAVDGSGDAVPPGSTAQRIYLTNLYNQTLPLIRLEVTDELTVLPERCPCGSGLRRIADPQGRFEETFGYGGRVSVHPHVFASVLGRYPALIAYQVHETERGADIAVVATAEIPTRVIARDIEARLANVGLDRPEVTVTRVAALVRHPSGKLKRFVPASPTPGAPRTAPRPAATVPFHTSRDSSSA